MENLIESVSKSSFDHVGIKKPTAVCPHCHCSKLVTTNDKGIKIFDFHYVGMARQNVCKGSYMKIQER